MLLNDAVVVFEETVKPVSCSQRNDGNGADSGPSGWDSCRRAFRPNRKFLRVTIPSALDPQANMLCARRRGGRTADITHLAVALFALGVRSAAPALIRSPSPYRPAVSP
jgi:hypothetical protein